MKTKTIFNKILWIIAAVFVALFVYMESAFSKTVIADETSTAATTYTDVLEDLEKDESFDSSKYVATGETYLKVIQIAESSNRELFIYVYRPSALSNNSLQAKQISLSTNYDGVSNQKIYDLTLLSNSGTLDKYIVNNFRIIAGDVMRIYGIISIYRLPTDGDSPASGDNTTVYTAIGVGQRWTAMTVDGKVQYAMRLIDLITVEKKHVGFIRYLDNFWFFTACTDSHYVAFTTDKPIDTLLEVDIRYFVTLKTKITNSFYTSLDSLTASEPKENYRTLYSTDIFSKPAQTWGADSYEYKRISTVKDFLTNETKNNSEVFTTETRAALNEMYSTGWVLRFEETNYSSTSWPTTSADSLIQNTATGTEWSEVTEVTLLRMEYEYQGDLYEVGVVDNNTSGDTTPDNENPTTPDAPDLLPDLDELWARIQEIMKTMFGILGVVVVGGLLLCIALPILPHIINLIAWLFKWIFKALWWVISFPFNLIGKLFNRKDK